MELDFLYVPSADVAADATYWVKVLGAKLVFAVEGMGARVAMLELGSSGPRILLTDHLEDKRTVLIYRVDDLDRTMKDLKSKGWKRGRSLEIPHGPCMSFETPGGQRVAIYELARPEVAKHFVGRADFEVGGVPKGAGEATGPRTSRVRARRRT
jgi:glyoxalase/bleomycin resistance protein/dioxygenase superfamily protein